MAPVQGALRSFLMLAAIAGPLVALHLHAVWRRRTNVLAGFWATLAITVMVLVATCLALLQVLMR